MQIDDDLRNDDRLTLWHLLCACVATVSKAHRLHPVTLLCLLHCQCQLSDTFEWKQRGFHRQEVTDHTLKTSIWLTYRCPVWYPASHRPLPAESTRAELVRLGRNHDQLSAAGIELYLPPIGIKMTWLTATVGVSSNSSNAWIDSRQAGRPWHGMHCKIRQQKKNVAGVFFLISCVEGGGWESKVIHAW